MMDAVSRGMTQSGLALEDGFLGSLWLTGAVPPVAPQQLFPLLLAEAARGCRFAHITSFHLPIQPISWSRSRQGAVFEG